MLINLVEVFSLQVQLDRCDDREFRHGLKLKRRLL